jgi:hypothetical protein
MGHSQEQPKVMWEGLTDFKHSAGYSKIHTSFIIYFITSAEGTVRWNKNLGFL